MDLWEAMQARHSVRQYTDRAIEPEKADALRRLCEEVNAASGLHIQPVFDEPQAFAGGLARYGRFDGVRNYFAIVGPPGRERAVGYYGERLVLEAQRLGLNTCWVALTFQKKKAVYTLNAGEKFYMVIALGYGVHAGTPHRNRPAEKLADLPADTPDWVRRGVAGALLAPTAMNQQKFRFVWDGKTVSVTAGRGAYTAVDLGIVQAHFDAACGRPVFEPGRESA